MTFLQVLTLVLCAVLSRSVMSDFLWSHGLQPTRLLCPGDFPGKNTGVDCHALLQEIFPTQGWTHVLSLPALAGRFFTTSATWEAPEVLTLVGWYKAFIVPEPDYQLSVSFSDTSLLGCIGLAKMFTEVFDWPNTWVNQEGNLWLRHTYMATSTFV